MEKEEVLKGNKLIAEFMGKNVNPIDSKPVYELEHIYGLMGLNDLKYNSSWDWLMPVIEKIAQDYDVRITWMPTALNVTYIDRPDTNDDEITSMGGMTAIENTWHCAIRFIEFYNKNKRLWKTTH